MINSNDLYGAEDAESNEQTSVSSGDENETSDGKTFVMDKSLWPDAKPGDEYSIRIVRVHEDSIEAEPCERKEEERPEENGEEVPPDSDGDHQTPNGLYE